MIILKKTSSNHPCGRDSEYIIGAFLKSFSIEIYFKSHISLWSRGQTEVYGLFCEFVAPPGRKTWLQFSVRDVSWGLRNTCFTKFSVVSFL